jgi:hypothetical protein
MRTPPELNSPRTRSWSWVLARERQKYNYSSDFFGFSHATQRNRGGQFRHNTSNRLTMNSQLSPRVSRVRLVIADVDGTLVTQDKVLTTRATEAVKKLHDAAFYSALPAGALQKE